MIKNEIQFLNVDVDIYSKFDLSELLSYFKPKMAKMYCGDYKDGLYLLAMEHDELSCNSETPDEIINSICNVFENLPDEAKEILEKVETVKFDLGFNSGDQPSNHRESISNKTLKRVVDLNAELAMTIYAKFKQK